MSEKTAIYEATEGDATLEIADPVRVPEHVYVDDREFAFSHFSGGEDSG